MVSVILPSFNERENVELLLYAIIGVLKNHGETAFEIVVVDDSTDDTFEHIRSRFRDTGMQSFIRMFHREEATGLASAIEYGIRQASGEYVLVMDSDFNHSPVYLPELIEKAREYDIVTGSRFVPGGGMLGAPVRCFGSRLFNLFVQKMLGLKTRDNLSGFWIMKKDRVLELNGKCPFFSGYGDYFIRMLFLVRREGLSFCEVPVLYLQRLMGESNTRFAAHLLRYLRTVFELRK